MPVFIECEPVTYDADATIVLFLVQLSIVPAKLPELTLVDVSKRGRSVGATPGCGSRRKFRSYKV